MTFNQVSLVSHADWSVNPSKRWSAVAVLQPGGRWSFRELLNVGDPSNFFTHLKLLQVVPGCILAGFDFPIGFPYAYAAKVGISDFLTFLPLLGQNEWGKFYLPARIPSELSLYRPFYPYKPGGTSRLHLETRLNISFDNLYRLCEKHHYNRRAACPLFWTMGSQQVGKAAISGWRDLLSPALSDPAINLKIWPFSGFLSGLCQTGVTVAVETYPAEFYSHIGLSFSSPVRRSKRRRSDRISFAHQLVAWSDYHGIELDSTTQECLWDGFGGVLDGEDKFDAFVGLYGMINIVQGYHPTGEPLLPHISNIEGWIFGQENLGEEVGFSRSI